MNGYSGVVGGSVLQTAAGWTCSGLQPASGLFGANGTQFGPDGRLDVAQAFGSQITAIDVDSGSLEVVSLHGGPIVGPDDVAFDSHGNMYVTEVMRARVSMRTSSGEVHVLADGLPSTNGIIVLQIMTASCRLCMIQHPRRNETTSFWDSEVC
jgi:hypothetical protein